MFFFHTYRWTVHHFAQLVCPSTKQNTAVAGNTQKKLGLHLWRENGLMLWVNDCDKHRLSFFKSSSIFLSPLLQSDCSVLPALYHHLLSLLLLIVWFAFFVLAECQAEEIQFPLGRATKAVAWNSGRFVPETQKIRQRCLCHLAGWRVRAKGWNYFFFTVEQEAAEMRGGTIGGSNCILKMARCQSQPSAGYSNLYDREQLGKQWKKPCDP